VLAKALFLTLARREADKKSHCARKSGAPKRALRDLSLRAPNADQFAGDGARAISAFDAATTEAPSSGQFLGAWKVKTTKSERSSGDRVS